MGTEGILIAMVVMGAVGSMVSRRSAARPVGPDERSNINMFSDYGDQSLPSEYYSAMAAVDRAVKEQNGTTGTAAPIQHRFASRPAATAKSATTAAFGKRAN